MRYHKCDCGLRFKSIQLNQGAVHRELEAVGKIKERTKSIQADLAKLTGIFTYS